jgi:ABC-type polysaccharide/polyol phosphate export permease
MVFLVVFPATFLANTFVPISGLPPVLRQIAAWNPVSTLAAGVRELFGNPTALPADASFALRHAVPCAVAWCLLLLVLAVPLAIRGFRKRTAD